MRLTLWSRKSESCWAVRVGTPPSTWPSLPQEAAEDRHSTLEVACSPWERQDSLSNPKNHLGRHLGHHLGHRRRRDDLCRPLRWLAESIDRESAEKTYSEALLAHSRAQEWDLACR